MVMGTPREIMAAGSWQAVRYEGVSIEKRSIGEASRSCIGGRMRTPIWRVLVVGIWVVMVEVE